MIERRNALRRSLSGGVVLGIGGAALLAIVEIAYVLLFASDAFDTVSESVRFAGFDALLLVGAGAMLGLVQGLGAAIASAAAERLAHPPASLPARDRWRALVGTGLVVPFVALAAARLLAGPQARLMKGRDALGIAGGVAALGAIYAFLRALLVARQWLARKSPMGHERSAPALVAAGGAIAVALVLFVADARVLPRLYPVFHLWLTLTAWVWAELAAGALFLAMAVRRRKVARVLEPSFALRAALVAVAALALSLAGFRRFQQSRAVVLEHAPAGAKALGLAAELRLAPIHQESVRPQPATGAAAALIAPGPQFPDSDVFLVTIDALRADHVGAYGYGRPTTPNLDALAARGVVFERAYSQIPHTAYSVATMLTGKYMAPLMALGTGEGHETLASIVRRYGIKTAAFFPPSVFYIDRGRFATYERSYYDFEYVKMEFGQPPSEEARFRTDQVLAYLETQRPGHAFVWIHYIEPHEPYLTHPGISFGPHAMDRYDGEIAYADRELGRLVAYLATHRPRALLIVTADHGEEFGDHGGRYHGSSLYDEQARVPLIVSSATPGVFVPHRVAGQVETVDIARTVLGLLDIPASVRMRGTDLGPWLASPPAPARLLPPAFASIEDLEMVEYRGSKLICDVRQGSCQLFDLSIDPREKHSLSDQRRGELAAMRGRLDAWEESQTEFEQKVVEGSAPARREAIERGRLGDRDAVPGLVEVLAHADPAGRLAAAQIFARTLRDPRAGDALLRALDDPDPDVRAWAAVAGARLGLPPALAAAKAIALSAASPVEARNRAALALVNGGDSTAVPPLLASLAKMTEDDADLAREICQALGALRDPRAVPALLASLSFVRARLAVVEALIAIGDRRAAPEFVRRLEQGEPYVDVRAAMAEGLGRLHAASALPTLERLLRRDTESSVVTAAAEALRSLGTPLSGLDAGGVVVLSPTQSGSTTLPVTGSGPRELDLSVEWPASPSQATASQAHGAHGAPGAAVQAALSLTLDGQPLQTIELAPGTRSYSLSLPAQASERRRSALGVLASAGARVDIVVERPVPPPPHQTP